MFVYGYLTEVLSKSTQNYDRKDKFTYYRSLPTLEEYILILLLHFASSYLNISHHKRSAIGGHSFRVGSYFPISSLMSFAINYFSNISSFRFLITKSSL